MKKLFAALLAGIVLTSMAVSVSAHESGVSYGDVPKADTTITIDGKYDEAEWKGALAIECDTLVAGDANNTTRGTAYLKWDEKNLYVYFDVRDNDVAPIQAGYQDWFMWNTDSIEVMLDFTNDASGDLFQYRVDFTNWASGQANNPATEAYNGGDASDFIGAHAVATTTTGYGVEMAINVADRGETLEAGDQIGLLLMVNDMVSEPVESSYMCVANWISSTSLGTGVWTPELYDYITIADAAPEAPADDTQDETVDVTVDTTEEPTEAPQTFDAGIIAAFAVMAISAGAVLSKKR